MEAAPQTLAQASLILEPPLFCGRNGAISTALRGKQGYRQVSISIEAAGGDPPVLSREDIRVVQGNREIPVEYFQQEPASLGILVDSSGSMEPKLPETQAAIASLIGVLSPEDSIFMFGFSAQPYLLQPFTRDHRLALQRVSLLHAYGQTALYDTLIDGLLTVANGCDPERALVLITDGMDNISRHSRDQVDALAKENSVPIYSIGIGDPAASSSPVQLSLGPVSVFAPGIDAVDVETLNALADETGARTHLVRPTGEEDKMRKDAEAIASEIDNHYVVGFIATDTPLNPVRIELRNHNDASIRIEGVPAEVAP